MLQAIEKLARSRAASVLSLGARNMLPQPGYDHMPSDQADQAAALALIGELKTKVVARTPRGGEMGDVIALQEALSREISSFLLSGADSAEVRARVGDKGALSPSSYRVTFSPKFKDGQAVWGLPTNY